MPVRNPLPLYPLRFRPELKNYVWGGRNLERIGRVLPQGPIAESWEVSDHPNGQTRVDGGALQGVTLGDLLRTHGAALVGTRNSRALDRGRFPLLVKLLDANDWLSVQVHPNDLQAHARTDDLGKTEMWIVLHADAGSEIILGFDRAVTPSELERALTDGGLDDLLHRVPARVGDVFFVPAGTIHAIGPGLLLAEIQQASDVTYRVYDWDRSDDGDAGRQLHVEQALEVTDFEIVRPGPVRATTIAAGPPRFELLAECPYFRTERITFVDQAGDQAGDLISDQIYRGCCDGSTFEIWASIRGLATVASQSRETELHAVSWLLLPASLGEFEIRASRGAELLRILTP